MESSHLQTSIEFTSDSSRNSHKSTMVSLESEIPEALYNGLKEFICANPHWDQYEIMSSALASFLFQNGCEDRVVSERYLSDLFRRP